jgi:hypothetical protein
MKNLIKNGHILTFKIMALFGKPYQSKTPLFDNGKSSGVFTNKSPEKTKIKSGS